MTPQQPRLPLDAPEPPHPWRPDRLLAQVDLAPEQRARVTREAGRRALPWSVVYEQMREERVNG